MDKYSVKFTLIVLGPFLTAASSVENYGLNKAFRRNHHGQPVIPASHIKGKLRTAFQEMTSVAGVTLPHLDVDYWLGLATGQGNAPGVRDYTPNAGVLHISDFLINLPAPPEETVAELATKTRTKIHKQTRTAAEATLHTFESLFSSGVEVTATGTMTYYASDFEEAQDIASTIKVGLQWMTTLGAEKGVGFGRLARVIASQPIAAPGNSGTVQLAEEATALQLRIRPLEPILLGGIKKRRTNYIRSERTMAGTVIKGALAARLNEAFGYPADRPLTPELAADYPGYEQLVTHYSVIRVLHGHPTYKNQPRPHRKPLSLVTIDEDEIDLALVTDDYPLPNGLVPTYFVDQKEYEPYAGAVMPREIFVTRTAIDEESRRSQEGQLFTYAFLCPEDDGGRPLEWVTNVDFANVPQQERRRTIEQFAVATQHYLDRLGKLNRTVQVIVQNLQSVMPKSSVRDGLVVLTLQSDAIMLNPDEVKAQPPNKDLHDLYAAYWQEIAGGSLALDDFFAYQLFEGGYRYHRYLGAHERTTNPYNYYPYYLTGAGSVFRLKVNDQQQAETLLELWQKQGLPMPGWAINQYGRFGGIALWQTCPYVPENGYGEIAINLDWHWNKRA